MSRESKALCGSLCWKCGKGIIDGGVIARDGFGNALYFHWDCYKTWYKNNKQSRWVQLEETSPSGNSLCKCVLCGRVSKTADKICSRSGCGMDEVSPEFLQKLEEENRMFEKMLEDMAHHGD